MIPSEILNPYDVDPASEYPHVPTDAENWTEYHYWFAYDPAAEIGISCHIGRIVEDLSIWRGILYVFLPGQEVLVRKYSGRDAVRGPGAGPLHIDCVEPMRLWQISFDGLVNSVPRASLSREPVRDGVDELISFNLRLEAAAPLSILAPSQMKGLTWSHYHTEQIMTMRGEFSYRGQSLALTGMAARDHSSGPRNSSKAIGAFWANILFPSGIAINANIARTTSFEVNTGYVYWGDGTPLEEIKVLATAPVNAADTPPNSVHCDAMVESPRFDIVVQTSRGDKTISVERLTTAASTYAPPHHEYAGTNLAQLDGRQMTKTVARCVMDGETGHGQLDRYCQIPTLKND